jgi:hypothetical protein
MQGFLWLGRLLMNVRTCLEQEIALYEKIGAPAIMQRFILRNGEEFRSAPFTGTRMTPRKCFSNAAELCGEGPAAYYAEGYGWRNDLPIIIHHAWCVDEKGFVIDPTWNDPEDCQYFGFKMKRSELWRRLASQSHYGLLDSGRGFNLKLMQEIDPGMKEFFRN